MRNFDKIVSKIDKQLDENKHYDAFQAASFLCHRIKYTDDNFSKCADCIYGVVKKLVFDGQEATGLELVNLYKKLFLDVESIDKKYIDQFLFLYGMFGDKHLQLYEINLVGILRKNSLFLPHRNIHVCLATIALRINQILLARVHVLHSDHPKMCVHFIKTLTNAHPRFAHYLISQFTFQLLCLKKVAIAKSVFITSSRPYRNKMLYCFPILNFIYLLFVHIEKEENKKIFNYLLEKYSFCLEIDTFYSLYLDRIGSLYFGTKSKTGNRLDPVFSSMFGSHIFTESNLTSSGQSLPPNEQFSEDELE